MKPPFLPPTTKVLVGQKAAETRAVCPACLYRPRRRVGVYCGPCIRAADQKPLDYDLDYGRQSTGAARARAEHLAARIASGAAAHEACVALLRGTLTRFERRVWTLYCQGLGEQRIARIVKRSQRFVYERVIGPLRHLAGLPVRACRSGPLAGNKA